MAVARVVWGVLALCGALGLSVFALRHPFGVMSGGAIAVAFIPFQKVLRTAQPKTVFNEPIDLPKNNQIDKKLITGAVLFGAGWGIAGICPAPSFTLIGLGHYQVLYFIVAMLVGVWIHRKWSGA